MKSARVVAVAVGMLVAAVGVAQERPTMRVPPGGQRVPVERPAQPGVPVLVPANPVLVPVNPVQPALPPLWGWVDLHTHPMSNLAFGGKLFHGAPDAGSLMPAVQMPSDPQCRFDVPASNIAEALSDDAPTHGDVFQSKCGDSARNALIQALEAFSGVRQPGHAMGFPTFQQWPRWNDVTHQKMWVDWIRRAHAGGLRVMVALSHNNRTLGELMGRGGPVTGAKDDQTSSDIQIDQIARFVARHGDFMEVARTPGELNRIVRENKLAIVLGIEIDNIGNFNDKPALNARMIEDEINRLYAQGVRYIFPVHVTDNAFGDAAMYDPLFNVANARETGRFWTTGCSDGTDELSFRVSGIPAPFNQYIPRGVPAPREPTCAPNAGHRNVRTPPQGPNPLGGLTQLGEFALRAMMKRGMIIDIDHMSHLAAERALQIAESVGAGYPLMSGHSAIRNRNDAHFNRENSRTPAQLERIACLGGMFGLGTSGAKAYEWAGQYAQAYNIMNVAFTPASACRNKVSLGPGMVAFGTDTNSMVKTPRPTMTDFDPGVPPQPRVADIYNPASPANADSRIPFLPRSQEGARVWDYNTDGVAHYGMFADFVKDVRTAPPNGGMTGRQLVDDHLLWGADYFFRMWQKAETVKANVP